jgi:Uma2 family endonuclease
MDKAEIVGRAATYKDLCDVPDQKVAEIIGGDLWVTPRPIVRHAHAAAMLTAQLIAPFGEGRGGPGGWWILPECEIHFRGDVLVPDLAGWRRSKLKKRSSEAFMTQAPDWACEISSPSTRQLDRVVKAGIYARERVRHVWFVDPGRRSLEVLKLAAGIYVPILSLKGDQLAAAEPFDAVPFPLQRLWLDR